MLNQAESLNTVFTLTVGAVGGLLLAPVLAAAFPFAAGSLSVGTVNSAAMLGGALGG